MMRIFLKIFTSIVLLAAITACGSGGGDSSSAVQSDQSLNVRGAGVKGPLANATVAVYRFDSSSPKFREASPIATATTNDAAAIEGLSLPRSVRDLNEPLIFEFSSTPETVDLTTNAYPVIASVRTVVVPDKIRALFDGAPVFATPLTTLALDIAINQSAQGESVDTFVENIGTAANYVVSTVGFGMSQAVNIFDTPPILSSSDTTLNAQSLIAELRTSVEALTAIIVELQNAIRATNPTSSVSGAQILEGLAADLSDGVIDGKKGEDVVAALRDVSNIAATISVDPASLFVPGTAILVSDVEEILILEAAATCACDASAVINYLADGSIDVLPTPVSLAVTSAIEAQLVGAKSLSSTLFELVFENPIDPVSVDNVENYRIYDTQGNQLTVLYARLGYESNVVLLTTDSQSDTSYRILVNNVVEEAQPDNGSSVVTPGTPVADLSLTTAVATSNTRLMISFSEPVTASAEMIANYQISSAVDDSPLEVNGAAMDQNGMTVTLITGVQQDIGYRIIASNILTLEGSRPIDASLNTKNFLGNVTDGAIPLAPAVAGAISTGNTSIVVSYTNPMNDLAIDPANYSVVQKNVNSEAGALAVVSAAFFGPDRKTVLLTTLSQSEVVYEVKAVNVQDVFAQTLRVDSTNTGYYTADTAEFAGTPAGSNDITDFDGDGLLDDEEQRGWAIQIISVNGQVEERQVTSDPSNTDTDGDGVSDAEEKHYRTSPRDADTDDDQLTDAQELNELYTDPFRQDSDGDSLTDGLEFNFFGTSPLFADTDGDQISDFDEIAASRNPRISDLPQVDIEVGDVNLALDYRFDVTTEQSTTEGDTQTVATTHSQSSEKTYSKSDSSTHEFGIKAGFEQEIRVGVSDSYTGFEKKFKFSQELTTNHSWSTDVTRGSAETSTKEHSKSLESSQEVTEGETINRVIEGARMAVPVYIRATSDIAFNLSNITITALVPSDQAPGTLVPVATLVPKVGDAENTTYSLGPLLPPKGPIEFVSETIFPSVVDDLMANPRGIIFSIVDYNITDEDGRNFAFTSQEVIERTAPLLIDDGGIDRDGDGISDLPERYRVAINYGLDIANDKRVIFDDQGKPVGVSFENVLQEVLGLTRYDESITPTDTLSPDEQFNSYATYPCTVTVDEFGTQETRDIIYRIRDTAVEYSGEPCNVTKSWGIIEPDGSVRPEGLLLPDNLIMTSNQGVRLGYFADDDGDGLTNRSDYLFGCSINNADTDGDSLDDRFEQLGVWRNENDTATDIDGNTLAAGIEWLVQLANGDVYEATSRCNSFDSDNDGLSDDEEYHRKILYSRDADGGFARDQNNEVIALPSEDIIDFSNLLASGGRTDPLNPDTDEDGVTDFDEIQGYAISLSFEARQDTTCDVLDPRTEVVCYTDPLNHDTDGDTLKDGDERRLKADPTVADIADVGDSDGDGLVNREETDGLTITTEKVSTVFPSDTAPGNPGDSSETLATSSTTNPDSDGDGLSDFEEYRRFPPTNPDSDDTDSDGLKDKEEIDGVSPTITSGQPVEELNLDAVFYPNPNDADSDNDGLTDGEEMAGWDVRLVGRAETKVAISDPTEWDADNDKLSDKDEKALGTNPWNSNTDGDEFGLSDKDEQLLGLDAKDASDFCVKATYTGFTVSHGFPDKIWGTYKSGVNAIERVNGVDRNYLISKNIGDIYPVTEGDKYAVNDPDLIAYFLMDNNQGIRLITNSIRFRPLNGSWWTVNPGSSVFVNASDFENQELVTKVENSGSGNGADVTSQSHWTFVVMNEERIENDLATDPNLTFCQGR